jgi:hypothetical protein
VVTLCTPGPSFFVIQATMASLQQTNKKIPKE